jgi:hypothetical protein
LPGADGGKVLPQALTVQGGSAGQHEMVRLACDHEIEALELPEEEGLVDQLGVIGGAITAESPGRRAIGRQGRRHLPAGARRAGRRLDVEPAGPVCGAFHPQEEAGAVAQGVIAVEVGGAHRQLAGIDVVDQRHRRIDRRQLPGRFVDFRKPDRPAVVGFSAQGDDVPGEIAHQIAAGNPGRQGDALAGARRRVDAAAHRKAMRIRRRRAERVVDRRRIAAFRAQRAG